MIFQKQKKILKLMWKKNCILNTRLSQGFPLRDLSEAGTGRVVIRERYTWAEPGTRNSETQSFCCIVTGTIFKGILCANHMLSDSHPHVLTSRTWHYIAHFKSGKQSLREGGDLPTAPQLIREEKGTQTPVLIQTTMLCPDHSPHGLP